MAPAVREEFRLTFVHHDGTDQGRYLLRGDQIDIGRTEGVLLFDDPYLAPRHARIATGGGDSAERPRQPQRRISA